MAKVLLVEDEGFWLDIIPRALPEYEVDRAQTYEEAIARLGDAADYDLAIVDLNLLPIGSDGLGRRLLEYMRENHPSIRRIGLTGQPLTAVRAVLDRYELDDLLLKDKINLSEVRNVVDAGLARAAGDVPDKFVVARLQLRGSLHSWEETVCLRWAQLSRTLRIDIRDAEHLGKKADESEKALAALEARQRGLEADSAELAARVANIRSEAGVEEAFAEFAALQARYEPEGPS